MQTHKKDKYAANPKQIRSRGTQKKGTVDFSFLAERSHILQDHAKDNAYPGPVLGCVSVRADCTVVASCCQMQKLDYNFFDYIFL